MRITKLFDEFFHSEKAGGLLLLFATAISLVLANASFGESYIAFWHTKLGSMSIEHWINDALMAIFFLMVGLELEREIYIGELSSFKKASLPILAAVGGMLIPAAIYFLFNKGLPSADGFGVPMATDIAFAIGILSLLGKRVPVALKVFLTALAVIDDLGAILVIALFYTSDLSVPNLLISLGIFGLLLAFNRLRIFNIIPYLVGGVIMWYFMHKSGVHASITGVLVAFAIPFGSGSEESVSYKLQQFLHKPVSFFIVPLFALANTCIPLAADWYTHLSESYSVGIIAGLSLGKPIGILVITMLGVMIGIGVLPKGISWKHILGIGLLGGIGFTMSIFITLLAFSDPHTIDGAKIAILIGSLLSAIVGFIYLKILLSKKD